MNARDRLTLPWQALVITLTVAGVLLSMNQVFFWNLFGISLLTNSFLYLVLGAFLPIVFLAFPARKKRVAKLARQAEKSGTAEAADDDATQPPSSSGVPWYDVVLALATMVVCVYLASNGVRITELGWEFVGPPIATAASFVLWALVLEALRRTGGTAVTVVALVFSLYPLTAAEIPVPLLQGIAYDLPTMAMNHAMGAEGILGLAMQTTATVLLGFLVFGVALQHTGGAEFFHKFASAIFGRYRGGAAKVSVASSASMGMMSGSAVSNVLTTGPMTIPAMKRAGFSPKYAAGIEATASSGGSITPPVMGTAAFLMVSFVGVPYSTILIAATIPAILYFLGIFLQVDAYSARKGLRGMPRKDLPRAGAALKTGWPSVAALALLTTLLFVMPTEAQVPWAVVALMLVYAAARGQFGLRAFAAFLLDCGKTLANIVGIIAGVGLIVGGLSATGVSLSLARELVFMLGDNVVLILIAGAITCFILGTGMTISAAYVFLAIVMAPAVIEVGVNPIAAHLFLIYWASVSYITPPVGLASFAAASIAKTPPMATALRATQLGAVKYIVPFGFALSPALVAQESSLGQILLAFAFAVVGVYGLACAIEGWAIGPDVAMPAIARIVAGVGGVALLMPSLLGALLGAAGIAVAILGSRAVARRRPADTQADEPAETSLPDATVSGRTP